MIRIAAALAAVVLLSGANGCCACAASKTYERRSDAAANPGAPVTLTAPTLHVLHFGDFGSPTCQQAAVAAAIGDAQRRKGFDLALHIGDNLYDCGPDWRSTQAGRCEFQSDNATVVPGYVPPPDDTFRQKFEDALGDLVGAGVPIYLALGNHDVTSATHCVPIGDPVAVGRAKACLEVAHRSPAWQMPARHYVLDWPPPPAAPIARFIVIDSDLVAGDYGGFTLAEEEAFLAAAAADCASRTCFVAAHHPAAAAGQNSNGFSGDYTARMAELVAAGGGNIRAWLSGHDHDLQHLRTPGGLDVLISGNGCRNRPDERFGDVQPPGATLLYATVRWGYAILDVGADGFTWRVEDDHGSARYCCAATNAGGTWTRCEPVSCN